MSTIKTIADRLGSASGVFLLREDIEKLTEFAAHHETLQGLAATQGELLLQLHARIRALENDLRQYE
jgi:hypothetical protein